MIEITKWPCVILTNYRTGSSALGYILRKKYDVEYFGEPTLIEKDEKKFLNIFNSTNKKFIVKIMFDQLNFLDSYHQLLNSDDCFKIQLLRTNELEQCISYYIAKSTQTWQQYSPTINNSYRVELNISLLAECVYIITENNRLLKNLDVEFDCKVTYEQLNLNENNKYFKITPPTNIEEISQAISKILNLVRTGNSIGHYIKKLPFVRYSGAWICELSEIPK